MLLQEIRKPIFEVDPEVEETIEYGMLGYTDFANLAAPKHYVSLYVSPRAMAKYSYKSFIFRNLHAPSELYH